MDAGSEVYKAFLAQGQAVWHGKGTGRPKNEEKETQSEESGEKGQPQEDGKKAQTRPEAGKVGQMEKAAGRAEEPERKTADKDRAEDAGKPVVGEKGKQGESHAESENEKRLIWMNEFVFERNGDSVILKRYRGNDSVVAVPSVIEAEGREFPVVGVWDKAFLGTPAEHVWVDAERICPEEWNPMAVRSGENSFLQVHWRNLSPQMEKTLKGNRKWAELELRHPSKFRDLMEGIKAVPESSHKKHSFFSQWREKRAAERQAAGRSGERTGPGREAFGGGVPDVGQRDRKISVRQRKNRGMDI